jgi:hypothetical protein
MAIAMSLSESDKTQEAMAVAKAANLPKRKIRLRNWPRMPNIGAGRVGMTRNRALI